MGIFGMSRQDEEPVSSVRTISWSVYSPSDRRWNGNGKEEIGCHGGIFVAEAAATRFVENKKKELCLDLPDDLQFTCMKD